MLLILLAALGLAASRADSLPEPHRGGIEKRSLEQLERISTLLRTVSDEVPGSAELARRCGLKPKEAYDLLRRLHPVWDEKVRERMTDRKVYQTVRDARGCEKSCICGAYASVLDQADTIEGVAQVRAATTAQTPEQGLACARAQVREVCSPGVLRELRRLPR